MQRRLEIEQALGGKLDLLHECGHDRRRCRRVSVVQVAGADRGLADRRQRPLAVCERADVDPAVSVLGGDLAEERRQPQVDRHLGAGAPAHGLPVHLREPTDVGAGEALEEVLGNGKAEDAVAEEGQAPVRVGTMPSPGRVGERLVAQALGNAVEQRAELGAPALAAGATARSSRCAAKPSHSPRHRRGVRRRLARRRSPRRRRRSRSALPRPPRS